MQILYSRSHFYQWDLNQRLTGDGLKVGDELHFANALSTEALVVKAYALEGGTVVADVPNILLRDAYPITAFRYVLDGDSEYTVQAYTFQVQKRPKPSDYIHTETAIHSYEQLAAEMIKALATIEAFNAEKDETLRRLDEADAQHDEAIEALGEADEAIRREIAEHKEAAARQNAANQERFGGLDAAVADLDRLAKHLDTDVQNLDTVVTNLDSLVANLDSKVTNFDTDVTNLETKVTNLDTQITNLDKTVTGFGTVVSNNDAKVTALEADVEETRAEVEKTRDDLAKVEGDLSGRIDKLATDTDKSLEEKADTEYVDAELEKKQDKLQFGSPNLFDPYKLRGDGIHVGRSDILGDYVDAGGGELWESEVFSDTTLAEACPSMVAGETYCISYESSENDGGGYPRIYLADQDYRTYSLNNPFTVTEEMLSLKLAFGKRFSYEMDGIYVSSTFTKIMVNEGTTPLSYVPYEMDLQEYFDTRAAVQSNGKFVKTFNADAKLDKYYGAYSRLYGTKNGGEQMMYPIGSGADAYYIAYRGADGVLGVGRAKTDIHAVPLAQMNEALTEKASAKTVDTLVKKVENLEAGTAPDMFVVDDATAYVKTIPTDAAPYAEILAVGGMTHKVYRYAMENLFDIAALEMERYLSVNEGIVTVDDPSALYYSSDAPFKDIFKGSEVGKKYRLTYDVSDDEGFGNGLLYVSAKTEEGVFTLTETVYNQGIEFGVAWEDTDYGQRPITTHFSNISLVEVTDVLLDTPVTALDITGKNLFDEKAITGAVDGNGTVRDAVTVRDGYVSIRYGSYGNSLYLTPFLFYVKEGQQVNVSADVFIPTGGAPSLGVAFGIGNPLLGFKNSALYPKMSAYDKWERASKTLTAKQTGYYFLILQGDGNASNYDKLDVRFKNIKVTTDTTDTTFSPYRKTTFAIPAAVQALEGYGWGITGTSRTIINGIEWDDNGKPTYVHRVSRVVYNGTESWSRKTLDYGVQFEKSIGGMRSNSTVISNKFPNGNRYSELPWIASTPSTVVIVPTNPPDTVEGWQAQLAVWAAEGNPLTVYYELAEPIVTDVSAYFTEDNLIPVEGGGTITAVNAEGLAAPTTIIYQKRGA